MLKEDKKRQKEKLAQMSRNEKITYIWSYYKWAILGAALIFIGFIYVIATPSKPKMEKAVNITFIGDLVNVNGATEFEAKLIESLPGLVEGNRIVEIQTYPMGESADPMMTMGNIQKLAAQIMSSDIDILVGDEEQLIKYAVGEAALPLENIFSQEELADLNLVSFKYTPSSIDGTKSDSYQVEYIDLSNKTNLITMIPTEKIGMIVMANSLRIEEARQVIDYLLILK